MLKYSASKKPADYESAYREFEKRAGADGGWPNSLDQNCYISDQEESAVSMRRPAATLGSSRQVGDITNQNRSAVTTGIKWNQAKIKSIKSGSVASQRSGT